MTINQKVISRPIQRSMARLPWISRSARITQNLNRRRWTERGPILQDPDDLFVGRDFDDLRAFAIAAARIGDRALFVSREQIWVLINRDASIKKRRRRPRAAGQHSSFPQHRFAIAFV